jgi:hypothetical protein
MKNNRSLAISVAVNSEIKNNITLGLLSSSIPESIFNESSCFKTRDRVFTQRNTLETMILTATLEDKSLKNSVMQYYSIQQNKRSIIEKELKEKIKKQKIEDSIGGKRKGRPRENKLIMPKSKQDDISLNTAAYSKARTRLPLEIVNSVFESSLIKDAKNNYSHWNNLRVFTADGTYLQLQDTKAIKNTYPIKNTHEGSYPQALLEVVTELGTGQVFDFNLSNRATSELPLLYELLDKIPKGSILLMDDLYNCYEILNKCIKEKIHFIVPAKRKRNYKLLKTIEKGDELVEIKMLKSRSAWAPKDIEFSKSLVLRKITCISPDGKEYDLLTSVIDVKISRNEIQFEYLNRWDIEITIREIKTIMDINILRSKTPEMLKKELVVALTAYNLIRKIIYASLKDLPFFPKENFIYKFYTINKSVLIDKTGRVYSKWSSGRIGNKATDSETNVTSKEARSKIR